jgi:hypothetical protein
MRNYLTYLQPKLLTLTKRQTSWKPTVDVIVLKFQESLLKKTKTRPRSQLLLQQQKVSPLLKENYRLHIDYGAQGC